MLGGARGGDEAGERTLERKEKDKERERREVEEIIEVTDEEEMTTADKEEFDEEMAARFLAAAVPSRSRRIRPLRVKPPPDPVIPSRSWCAAHGPCGGPCRHARMHHAAPSIPHEVRATM